MTAIPPLGFRWDGEAMVPLAPRVADRHYVIGEVYRIAPYEERSGKSHNHEFAWLAEAWRNLPEKLAEQFPSPEHLRKRALIEAGFYDEQIIDAGSKAAAERVAMGLRGRPGEEFSVIVVRGPMVVMRQAKSQSRRAMGAKAFQESKDAILEIVSGLIGVAPAALVEQARAAA